MGINKVIYNGQVLIDLTSSTVTPETLLEGVVAFNSSGDKIVGTYVISTYTNQVPLSINEDGTIYNVVGFKNGYRVRSGGAEAGYPSGACTGFIPVKPNDIIRLKGWDMKVNSTANCINISDSSFTNLGQWSSNNVQGYGSLTGTPYAKPEAMMEEGNGVYKWQVPPAEFNVAYIRVSGQTGGMGTAMIVTVNQEITKVEDSVPDVAIPYTEVTYTEVGTHSFTVPDGVSKVKVAVIGGGGGYAKTADILPSGASSFGDIVAMGGGNAYQNGKAKPVIAEPNGKTVDADMNDVSAGVPLYFDGAKGFNLDFTLDDGEYGAGGKCGFIFPMSMSKEQLVSQGILVYGAFSGAKVIETLEVSAGETYTVVVGGGGGITVTPQYMVQDNASANGGGTKGNDGAVLVAFGGDI